MYYQYQKSRTGIEVLVNQYFFSEVLNIGTDYFKNVLVHTLIKLLEMVMVFAIILIPYLIISPKKNSFYALILREIQIHN